MKIPPSAIANAKGIAIFTVFRTGFHWSAGQLHPSLYFELPR